MNTFLQFQNLDGSLFSIDINISFKFEKPKVSPTRTLRRIFGISTIVQTISEHKPLAEISDTKLINLNSSRHYFSRRIIEFV